MSQQKIEEITLYLNQSLAEYEVIPANFGWYIHFKDKYCGHLQYQAEEGWQGEALNHFSTTIRDRLNKFKLLKSRPDFTYTQVG